MQIYYRKYAFVDVCYGIRLHEKVRGARQADKTSTGEVYSAESGFFSCCKIVEEIYFAGLRKTKKFQKNFSELPRQRGEKAPYIGEEVKGS